MRRTLDCPIKKSRPGRLARLFTADKRFRSKVREEMPPPPPKLSAEQIHALQKAKRRMRELFREISDDLLKVGMLDELINLLRSRADR
jgi:hypothetical protein